MTENTIDTTRQAVPFDTANIPGPKMAKAVMPSVAGKMLAKAKRPLLIIGSDMHDQDVLRRAVEFGKRGITIAVTGDSYRAFADSGVRVYYMNMHALAYYLCDPEWKGFDGKGNYDTVVILGFIYYYASQAISAIKNFTDKKIISIDKYYHPNASVSFGNLKDEIFPAVLDEVLEHVKEPV